MDNEHKVLLKHEKPLYNLYNIPEKSSHKPRCPFLSLFDSTSVWFSLGALTGASLCFSIRRLGLVKP